jgi:hypothetical protein
MRLFRSDRVICVGKWTGSPIAQLDSMGACVAGGATCSFFWSESQSQTDSGHEATSFDLDLSVIVDG